MPPRGDVGRLAAWLAVVAAEVPKPVDEMLNVAEPCARARERLQEGGLVGRARFSLGMTSDRTNTKASRAYEMGLDTERSVWRGPTSVFCWVMRVA